MENEFRAYISNFTFLNSDEAEIIVENTILQEFNKGYILLKEGSISKECYAAVRGCIREFYIKDGLGKPTAFFTEGHSVNSFSSYTNQVPSKHFLEWSVDCLLTVGNTLYISKGIQRFVKSQDSLLAPPNLHYLNMSVIFSYLNTRQFSHRLFTKTNLKKVSRYF